MPDEDIKNEQQEDKKPEEKKPEGEQKETKEKESPKYLTKDDFQSAVSEAVKLALKNVSEEQEKSNKEKEAQEKNDYKSLYEESKKKLDELTSRDEAAVRYAKKINDTIDAQVKDWPVSVKKSDPGAEDADARMNWFDSHSEMAKELMSKSTITTEHGSSRGGSGKERNVADEYMNSRYGAIKENLGLIGGKK